jgi:hypothetical protein
LADNFITLSNRLLSRAPAVGIALSQQLINDSWHTLQSKRDWSWRRGHGTIAPPNLYQAGTVTTHVADGDPFRLTGNGTVWTPDMVGRQIRIGGLLQPYYTITAWVSATELRIDQPWAGVDVTNSVYQLLQIYYPMPEDFKNFYTIYSVKDAYRLWTSLTESDLAMLDPQRANQGQTYAAVFYDYTTNYSGEVGDMVQLVGSGPSPVATTTTGFSYPANATYVVQVVAGGITGVATFQWKRVGQTGYQPETLTLDSPQDLVDGVQIYWPIGYVYVPGDTFMVQCTAGVASGAPRYELWPGPTFTGYLYPYIYMRKEWDLTPENPQLPAFVANRGEVLLEMALAAVARWPGTDNDDPNPYFSLALAKMHDDRAEKLLWDMERDDEEVGVTNITYENYPYAPAPWADGNWQQTHAPFLPAV